MFAKTAIMAGAFLWGTLAIFVKQLTAIGFTEMEIVAIRVSGAFLCLIPIVLAAGAKETLRINICHLWLFIGTGLLSIVVFNWAYFKAMNIMSISLAVLLLYTGPAFVAVLSAAFLKEKMSGRKWLSVIVTVVGCGILALCGGGGERHLTLAGLLIGLCSGLGYALYSIFGKVASRHYSSMTVTFYTFLVAAASLAPFFPFWKKMSGLPASLWLYMAGLGLIPTVIAFLLYTYGLNEVEPSLASVLATVEPAAAILIGVLLFQDPLSAGQIVGMCFIISSIFIISSRRRKTFKSEIRARREGE